MEHTESSAIRAATVAKPARQRARVSNNPLTRANGNTPQGRRTRDLYRSFLQHVSNSADDITRAAVLAAAELVVAAENARADLLAGSGDVEQVVRLENLAARSVRRLGIKHNAEPPSLTLEQHLANLAREHGEENAA